MSENRSVNFLRGVPADEALSALVAMASEGYRDAIARYGVDVLQYGHFTGFAPLRKLIGGFHGVDAQRVVVGNGGMEMISLFFKSLPRQSTIIVEACSYDRVLLDAACFGHRLVGVALTPDGVDLNQFREAVARHRAAAFYGIPFHQNPTGITYTAHCRGEVERLCRRYDIACVWDICYQDLRYDGHANVAVDVADWGPILTSSFTKTIAPGTKCGYMIVPERYVDHFAGVIANTRINPNLPTQAFIADFIESGRYATFLEHLRRLYRPRMETLNDALRRHFPGAYPVDISGGFFAPLTLAGIAGDREAAFIQSAKAAGVGIAAAWQAIAPDAREAQREKGLFIRLTFPAFRPDQLDWGLAKLKETAARFA